MKFLERTRRPKAKKFLNLDLANLLFRYLSDIVNELKNNAYQNKYLPMQGLNELREDCCKIYIK